MLRTITLSLIAVILSAASLQGAEDSLWKVISPKLDSETVFVMNMNVKGVTKTDTYKQLLVHQTMKVYKESITDADKYCKLNLIEEVKEMIVVQNADQVPIYFLKLHKMSEARLIDCILKIGAGRNIKMERQNADNCTDLVYQESTMEGAREIRKDRNITISYLEDNIAAIATGKQGREYLVRTLQSNGGYVKGEKANEILSEIKQDSAVWLMVTSEVQLYSNLKPKWMYLHIPRSGDRVSPFYKVKVNNAQEVQKLISTFNQMFDQASVMGTPLIAQFRKNIRMFMINNAFVMQYEGKDSDIIIFLNGLSILN